MQNDNNPLLAKKLLFEEEYGFNLIPKVYNFEEREIRQRDLNTRYTNIHNSIIVNILKRIKMDGFD